MSNRAQITQQAARDGVPAPTVERDYVLAHIIAALGALDDGHGLVFKGGTALRLCYFEDYRYSADLDFSVVEDDLEAAYATIETALTAVTGAVDAGELGIAAIYMLSSLLSIGYLMPIVVRAFFRPLPEGVDDSREEAPLLMLLPICTTALLCFVTFVYAGSVYDLLAPVMGLAVGSGS